MRVYHFLNHAYGIESIEKKCLKVARVSELNDPFEFFSLNLRDSKARAPLRKQKAELNKSLGLLCFSKNWHNPVLWSHYAFKHTGLCLGFDVPKSKLKDINYERDRLLLELTDDGLENFDLKNLLLTKYEHWSYEDEVRRFINLEYEAYEDKHSKHYFYSYDTSLILKEVIIGANSSIKPSYMQKCLSQSGQNATILKSRLAFQSFKVVPQSNKALWE